MSHRNERAPEVTASEALKKRRLTCSTPRVYHTEPTPETKALYPIHRVVKKGAQLFVMAETWNGVKKWSPVSSYDEGTRLILMIGGFR